MTFWEIFIAVLKGLGAATLAVVVVGVIVWALVYCVGFLMAWAGSSLGERRRRRGERERG